MVCTYWYGTCVATEENIERMNASNSRVVGPCGKHAGRVRVEGESGASRVRVETRTRDVGCDVYRN